MLLKQLAVLLTATMLSFSSFAGPEQNERSELCEAIAEWSSQAASAKVLGLSQVDFEEKLGGFSMFLLSRGAPEDFVKEAVGFMREAYINGYPVSVTLQETYKACMARKAT